MPNISRLEQLREQMEKVTGPFLLQRRPRTLAPRVVSDVEEDGYLRRLLRYQSDEGQWTPAYLLVPRPVLEGRTTAPGVLALHPTDHTFGHRVVVGVGGRAGRDFARRRVPAGQVRRSPASRPRAAYLPDLAGVGEVRGTMRAVGNNVRGCDPLEALPYVRPGGVGAVGHSLG